MIHNFKMVSVLMAVVAMFALTTSAAQATFTSAAYPATIEATSTSDVIDMFGSTGKCKVGIVASRLRKHHSAS